MPLTAKGAKLLGRLDSLEAKRAKGAEKRSRRLKKRAGHAAFFVGRQVAECTTPDEPIHVLILDDAAPTADDIAVIGLVETALGISFGDTLRFTDDRCDPSDPPYRVACLTAGEMHTLLLAARHAQTANHAAESANVQPQ